MSNDRKANIIESVLHYWPIILLIITLVGVAVSKRIYTTEKKIPWMEGTTTASFVALLVALFLRK
jgi:hypothetical protein